MTDLVALVRAMGNPRVVVVGDLILDRYVFGTVGRISPEAPIPVLRVRREEERPGGASCVASDLNVLGADVRVVGFVGDDTSGQRLRMLLEAQSIGHDGVLVARSRPTTLKVRMLASSAHHNQQMLRVDREHVDDYPQDEEDRLFAAYETALEGAHGVVVSDYAKGTITRSFVRRVIDAARAAGLPVVVDPKGTEYDRYTGATVVTPNRKEARETTGINPRTRARIAQAGKRLLELSGAESVVVKVDKDGLALVQPDREAVFVHSEPKAVFDVTGAGDMVAAVLGFALADGCDLRSAVRIANTAAGVEVGKVGAVPVTREEIVEALGERPDTSHLPVGLQDLVEDLAARRAAGESIVFTNGCFDILHAGHTQYLEFARDQGDLLVVGLNSDASVRRLKGESRPVHGEEDRARVLAALRCVDYVVIFDDDTPLATIEAVLPDVLVKGEDWRDKGVVGREVVEARGGKVVLAPLLAGRSTTRTIEKAGREGGGEGARGNATGDG